MVAQPHCVEHAVDVRRRRTHNGGEVAEVLGDREVGIDGRRLRDVPDPSAQGRIAGRPAEHLDRTGRDDLHTDQAAQQGGLARTAGTKQPGDRAGRDRGVEPMQDFRTAAAHPQPPELHRRGHATRPPYFMMR